MGAHDATIECNVPYFRCKTMESLSWELEGYQHEILHEPCLTGRTSCSQGPSSLQAHPGSSPKARYEAASDFTPRGQTRRAAHRRVALGADLHLEGRTGRQPNPHPILGVLHRHNGKSQEQEPHGGALTGFFRLARCSFETCQGTSSCSILAQSLDPRAYPPWRSSSLRTGTCSCLSAQPGTDRQIRIQEVWRSSWTA